MSGFARDILRRACTLSRLFEICCSAGDSSPRRIDVKGGDAGERAEGTEVRIGVCFSAAVRMCRTKEDGFLWLY
jgi:hypothetical protein